MKTVSAAFAASQAAKVAEPKLKMLAVLPNVAHYSKGASAAASDVFSEYFPAFGAIDGDATHVNYGQPGTTNGDGGLPPVNGYGRAGWRSASAAVSSVRDTNTLLSGGTFAGLQAFSGEVVPSFNSSIYSQAFDGLTLGELNGQGGWTADSSSGTYQSYVTAGIGRNGSYGLRLYASGGGYRYFAQSFTFGTKVLLSFRIKQIANTNAADTFQFQFHAGTTEKVTLSLRNGREISNLAGTFVVAKKWVGYTSNDYAQVSIVMDRTTVASTIVYVYVDGVQVDQYIVDSTGINKLRMGVYGPGSADYYIDDIRVGDYFAASNTVEYVADMGAAPVSTRGILALTGANARTERFISGAWFGNTASATAAQSMATGTTDAYLSQTFTPGETTQLDIAYLRLVKTGTVDGDVYLAVMVGDFEIAQSKPVLGSAISTTTNWYRFDFPIPVALTSGVTYRLVLKPNYVASASNYISWYAVTAGGYAGGSSFRWAVGTGWVALSTDFQFALGTASVEVGGNTEAMIDATVALNNTSAASGLSQGFTLDAAVRLTAVHTMVRGTTSYFNLATANGLYLEIRNDDGTGKPGDTVLARSFNHSPSGITWTGSGTSALYRFAFALTSPVTLNAATQYHLVVRSDWDASATYGFVFGVDGHSTGYTRGNSCLMSDAGVFTVQTWRLAFALIADNTPYFSAAACYSDDGTTYGAYASIFDNPSRLATTGDIVFTGQLKRYWKVKLTANSMGSAPALNLTAITTKAVFAAEKTLTVDLGQTRTVTRVELYGHPDKGGFRVLRVLGSTDGSTFASITDVDGSTLEARKRGGGATAIVATGVVTTDGDFLAINFGTDKSYRYLRVAIADNVDEYARVLELRAFRTIDVTARVKKPTTSQKSDWLLKKVQSKQLTFSLVNTDRAFSALNTASPYYGETGAGVRFILYTGYKGATDWLKQGTFYVDRWQEQSLSGEVNITASDGVRALNVTKQIANRTNIRNSDLLEYMANLGGIPSQDLDFERSSNFIPFIPAGQVNLWEEMRKVAQAGGGGKLYFDVDGYLRMEADDGTGHDTNMYSVSSDVSKFLKVYGPTVELGGKLYACATVGVTTTTEALWLCEYNPETGTWAQSGAAISTKGKYHGAALFAHNGKIVVLDFDAATVVAPETGPYTCAGCDLWEYTPGTAVLKQVGRWVDTFDSPYSVNWLTHVKDGIAVASAMRLNTGVTSGGVVTNRNLYALNLATMARKRFATAATNNYQAFVTVQGRRYGISAPALKASDPSVYDGQLRLYHVDFHAHIADQIAPPSNAKVLAAKWIVLNNDYAATRGELHVIGACAADGNDFFMAVGNPDYKPTPQPTPSGYPKWYIWRASVASSAAPTAVAEIGQGMGHRLNWSDKAYQSADCGGLAYANGLLIGLCQYMGPAVSEYRLITCDPQTGEVATSSFYKQVGNTSYEQDRNCGQLQAFTLAGKACIYGVWFCSNVFELVPGRGVLNKPSTVLTARGNQGGILCNAILDSGEEAGGDSVIANVINVTASPWVLQNSQQLYKDSQTYYAVSGQGFGQSQQVEFSDYCTGAKTISATVVYFGGSFTAGTSDVTWKLDADPKSPTLSWFVNLSPATYPYLGIKDITITGTPFAQTRKMEYTVIGDALGIERNGEKTENVVNNYVTDQFCLAPMVAGMMRRLQKNVVRATGVSVVAVHNLELFDRVRVTEVNTGVDADFYVNGITQDWGGAMTSLDLVSA